MPYTTTGEIHSISELEVITERFKKREVVLRVDESGQDGKIYPQYLKFQFANRVSEYPMGFQEGQKVNISFNLRGRLGNNGACYTSLDGFKISAD
jgi:hypothetical protein